jgi:hypothetical protein
VVIYELKGERRTSGQGDFRGAVGCEGKNLGGGGHYGGLNFFEGDKKMYSVSRTREKKILSFL